MQLSDKDAGHGHAAAVADAAHSEPLHRMEDVVKRTGLTPRAIRYYEEVGLLEAPSRTAGGFRLFAEAEIAKLVRIKELQTLLGFSLAEIKESLHVDAMRAELRQAYERATDPQTRLGVVEQGITLLQSQIGLIDERVARLMQLRREYAERLSRLHAHRTQIREAGDAGASRRLVPEGGDARAFRGPTRGPQPCNKSGLVPEGGDAGMEPTR